MLHATLVVPSQGGSWRTAILSRVRQTLLPEGSCQLLAAGDWRLNGRRLSDDKQPAGLVDCTLRLNLPGLAGGMPPKM
eukprot:12406540-Karenia_brevis.AAC.1